MIPKIMSRIKARKSKQILSEQYGFSDFFNNASAEEKRRLFLEVAREANQDQRDLVRKYDEIVAKGMAGR